MKIPKILHQTWKDHNLPKGLERLSNTWQKHHPDWEFRLWTDADNNKFIETFFPSFKERYESYPSNIQRVDAVRYLILYQYGGMFVDLDFECYKNMEDILDDVTCLFGQEPAAHCQLHDKHQIISNALMAAAPGHAFLREIYQELNRPPVQVHDKNSAVLESTGPFMVTRMYEGYKNREEIKLLDHDLVYPLTKAEIAQLFTEGIKTPEVECKMKQAYAMHYYAGTWWDANSNVTMLEEELA